MWLQISYGNRQILRIYLKNKTGDVFYGQYDLREDPPEMLLGS